MPKGKVVVGGGEREGEEKKSKPPSETGNTCRALSKARVNKSQAGAVRAAGSFGGIGFQVRGWSELDWEGDCTASTQNSGGWGVKRHRI